MKAKNKIQEGNCIPATPSCSSPPVKDEINKRKGYIVIINYQCNLPEDFPNSK
jgi:hypothetical protein